MSTLTFASLKNRFAKQSVTATESPVTVAVAQNIVSLLNGKAVDESGVAAFIHPALADKHLPTGYAGREVTYGELKLRLSSVERRNGTVGAHYPVVYSLSEAQAETIRTVLRTLSDKSDRPKGGRRKATAATPPVAQPATPVEPVQPEGLAAEVAELRDGLKAIVELLIERESNESATPTPGHTKTQPATPVEPVISGPVYRAGDVIWVELSDGTVAQRQISPDAKRLNSTIA